MIILGLDISSSRIGYCLINENEDLLLVDEIKLKPSQSLEERADIFKKSMKIIKEHSEVEHVFIEQPFMAFSGGKTTAATGRRSARRPGRRHLSRSAATDGNCGEDAAQRLHDVLGTPSKAPL